MVGCFQSTYPELTQILIDEVFRETNNKLQLLKAGEKLPAIGQRKGSKESVMFLIKIMNELQRNKRILVLPPNVSLNIWLFSNSGRTPHCDVLEIPNESLLFLWEASKHYRQEIESILKNDPDKIDFQLLECIKRKSEYYGFYPYKGSKPASKGLFELYQTKVLGNSSSALKLAGWFAYQIKLRLSAGYKNDKKLLTKLVKENAYGNKDKTILSKMKGIFAHFAEEGFLALEDYTMLFPREKGTKQISVKKDAFKWIWFYLNHEDVNETKPEGGDNLFTHPLIKIFAKDTFDYYQREKEIKYIKKNILDAFKKGEVTTSDLQRWFLNLAEIKDGYTNEAWDDLCRDDNGNNITHEVRFQFRLEMANLYRLAVAGNKITEGGTVK